MMTKAKILLEAFKWNPDWGNLLQSNFKLRKIKYAVHMTSNRVGEQRIEEGYIFIWKGYKLVLNNFVRYWYVDEYSTGVPILCLNKDSDIPVEDVLNTALSQLSSYSVQSMENTISRHEILNHEVHYI